MADTPSEPLALTIVVPTYEEQARVGPTLTATLAYLTAHHIDAEVIVVDDGSRDATVTVVNELRAHDPRLKLFQLPVNRGKGAAVRAGMLRALGARVLFMDADLATPMEELSHLSAALDEGYDIAIGSRALEDSKLTVRQHPAREVMGRGFNLLVRALAVRGIRDTQCGFKLFTREAAKTLFREAKVDRFAFDVEILLLAQGRFRVKEVPVAWRHVAQSRVSPLRDATRMALDLARMRWQMRK